MTTTPRLPPELLAPAGDWNGLRAAAANGADAAYFGLEGFNARRRATNFKIAELPRVIAYLHERNVKAYVTFNTLIYTDELSQTVEYATAIAEAGADAVIVQDLGLARLIRRLAPALPIHASTQMTQTEPGGIEYLRGLGVNRVILARELSLLEIERITRETPMELEVFVHGALCISYSGQCLASESMWGRSANRGLCAQACRLPYKLVVDGRVMELGEREYLLSTQDLAAYDRVADLMRLGVAGLKIEGRLKDAHYVAAATRMYRTAIDAAVRGERFEATPREEAELALSFSRGQGRGYLDGIDHGRLVQGRFPKKRGIRLGVVIAKTARGVVVQLSEGATEESLRPWPQGATTGSDAHDLGVASAPRGRRGTRENPPGLRRFSRLVVQLKPGDGVVFGGGRPEQDEQGGRVYSVTPWRKSGLGGDAAPANTARGLPRRPRGADASGGADAPVGMLPVRAPAPHERRPRGADATPAATSPQCVELTFGRDDVNLAAVDVGSEVWKTDDPALRRRLESSFRREPVARRVALSFRVRASADGQLTVEATDDKGRAVSATWPQPLEAAVRHPLTLGSLREQLERLGNTPFELGAIELIGPEGPTDLVPVMTPKSVLNDLRRQVVKLLVDRRTAEQRHAIVEPEALERIRREIRQKADAAKPAMKDSPCRLHVLVRDMAQLDAVLRWTPPDSRVAAGVFYGEFANLADAERAVALGRETDRPVGLAVPRVMMPDEEGLLDELAALSPQALLVRNLGGWQRLRTRYPELPLIGDYSLNAANEITADILAAGGLERVTPSYDLNWPQLAALVERFPALHMEVVIHQHVPMFHMRYCLFAAHMKAAASSCITAGGCARDIRWFSGVPRRPQGTDATERRPQGADATPAASCDECRLRSERACEKHAVRLRDRRGVEHPVRVDAAGRNTVYNAAAQAAAEFLPTMLHAGLRHFRVELLDESPGQAAALLNVYAELLAQAITPDEALRRVRTTIGSPVTPGTWRWE